MSIIDIRKEDFFKQLNISPITLGNYRTALKGKVLQEIINEVDGNKKSIFEITDLDILWDIYCKVNIHPSNIKHHRGISCAVMKYIRFLNNGEKIGRRIDYGKKR